MRSYGPNVRQRSAWATDQVMLDGKNGLSDNPQGTFQKQIEDSNYRARQAVFHGDKQHVSSPVFYGRERGIEGGARKCGDGVTEKLKGGRFAEGPGLALKCYTRFLEYHVLAVLIAPMGEGNLVRLALMRPRVSSMISRSAGKRPGGDGEA